MESAHVRVEIDLGRIRSNAQNIAQTTGVDLIAVVKADAYGLGARPVVESIADLCRGLCVFSLDEARRDSLHALSGKPILTLGPADSFDPEDFLAEKAHPSVWSKPQVERLARTEPVLCLDTGMQRFACPRRDVETLMRLTPFTEAFTHATKIEHVRMLEEVFTGRGLYIHASGSSLLNHPDARLNAVRPGIALYRGATRVTSRLVDARKANGPAGYTGFLASHFGVIIVGYSNGLRRGPCIVNGRPQTIIEVGMQSAFVTLEEKDQSGDEVVILGDGLTESRIAAAWGTSEQQTLLILDGAGKRTYRPA